LFEKKPPLCLIVADECTTKALNTNEKRGGKEKNKHRKYIFGRTALLQNVGTKK
jgi:hypothetical protein